MFVLATLVIGSTLCQGVCLSGGGYLLLSSVPAFGDALVALGKASNPQAPYIIVLRRRCCPKYVWLAHATVLTLVREPFFLLWKSVYSEGTKGEGLRVSFLYPPG